VEGVATEEQCGTLIRDMQWTIDAKHQMLFDRVEIEDEKAGYLHELETPLVIGMLGWILSSSSRRRTNWYPTRSLGI